jgi:hypothetical protein
MCVSWVQVNVVPTFVMQKWERIQKEEYEVCGIFVLTFGNCVVAKV